MPSILSENYVTLEDSHNVSIQGGLLYALGFTGFDLNSKYYLYPLCDGLVLVSGKCVAHFVLDSDGFGEEWLHDYWYVDDNLSKIPGLEINKMASFTEARYGDYREKALKLLKNRT